MTKLLVENIIAATAIHQQIPLESLANTFPDATFEKEEQPVLIIRYDTPKRAVFVLPDGQLFCTGTTSLFSAKETMRPILDAIEEQGITFDKYLPIEIHTITASFTLSSSLDLALVKDALHDEKVAYEESQSLWLEYWPSEKITVLIFPSGKLILTGETTLDELKTSLRTLLDTLTLKGAIEKVEEEHA